MAETTPQLERLIKLYGDAAFVVSNETDKHRARADFNQLQSDYPDVTAQLETAYQCRYVEGKPPDKCLKQLAEGLASTVKKEEKKGEAGTDLTVATFGGLHVISGPLLALDRLKGLAPPTVVGGKLPIGLAAIVLPTLPGPPGAALIMEDNPDKLSDLNYLIAQLTNRLAQAGYIAANVVFATHDRPPDADYNRHSDEPNPEDQRYDEDHNTSEQKVDLLTSRLTEPILTGNQINHGLTGLYFFRSADEDPVTPLIAIFLNAGSIASLDFLLTNQPGHINPEQTLQEDRESRETDDGTTAFVEDNADADGDGAEGDLEYQRNTLVNAVLASSTRLAQWHNAMLAKIPYRIGLQSYANEYGSLGSVLGAAVLVGLYGLSYAEPWTDEGKRQPAKENGELTMRGERLIYDGIGTPIDIGLAFLADGHPGYMVIFANTHMRLQNAISRYYPRLMGPLANEDGGAEHHDIAGMSKTLGMDPAFLGYVLSTTYYVAGSLADGVNAGLVAAKNPGDWRNTFDMVANWGIDAATVGTTYQYTSHTDLSGDAKKKIWLATGGAVATRNAFYWLARLLGPGPDADDEHSAQVSPWVAGGPASIIAGVTITD